MKILSWNVRALDDDDKCSLVRDTINSCCPSVVCLHETKLASLTPFKLRWFLPMKFTDHAVTLSEGTSGGILVAWNSSSVAGQVVVAHRYHITVKLVSTETNCQFLLTAVYAPCLSTKRSAFFEAVSEVAADLDTPWAVLGDFNMYRFSHEKSRGRLCWTTMEHLNSWIREQGLDDIPIENKLFTWSNKRNSPTLVCLDHVLVNAA